MGRRVKTLAGALLLSLALESGAAARDRVIYTRDCDGRQVGTTRIRDDGSVQYYDRQGRRIGSAVTRPDGSVIYYDREGRQCGSDKVRR